MIQRIQLLKCCSLAGVAVVAVLLMFSVSLSGQTLAGDVTVAGLNRPVQVPEDFVVTPFGYFHPSCVLQISEGDTLLADGRVEHADGTVDAFAPVCSYPHYTNTGMAVIGDTRELSGADAPVINGWLEAIWATTTTSYGKITSTWIVPPSPTDNDGQTLFFFPGFEDYSDVITIVQPVLQFGPSAAGGGNYWALSSWNCCINGVTESSPLLQVSSGDAIVGRITPTCEPGQGYCATWNIVSADKTTGKKTTLAKTPAEGQVWNWAFGAVAEVYGVVQCGDFPADSSLVFTTKLFDQNRKVIENPGWTPSYAGSGTKPWCNYGLNITPKVETLEY